MKRLLSLIMTAIMCLCMLMALTGCSEPPNNYVGWNGNYQDSFLYDDKNLFSDTQRQELDEMIQQKAKELEMNILIYVNGTYRSDYETKDFCDCTYEAFFQPDTDGLMYYLDLSSKVPAYDYISTSGKAILLYEENRESIFSHMDLYLPSSGSSYESDQIYDAVVEFLNQLSVYANNGNTSHYYHDESKGTYIYYKGDKLYVTTRKPLRLLLPIWFASAIIGLVTALITFLISKRHYTFKAKTNPSVYLSKDSVNFTQKSDNHIRTYQTRHRISSSSSGGGGHRSGGGGGHHSSGSHGGGGHHR